MQNQDDKTEIKKEIGKNIAHYQTWLNVWMQSRMEVDKALLTISSLALGLLFYSKPVESLECHIWVSAGLAFIVTIIGVLITFWKNADYAEKMLGGNIDEISQGNRALKYLSITTFITFSIAVILTFLLAILR